MESELVTGSDSNNGGDDNSPPIRYTDSFEKACPYYLSIGMTWEQYWDGDNTMVKYFRKADNLRTETKNAELWLQGLYIYRVMEAFAPILPAFPKKNARVGDYLSEPIPLTEQDAHAKEEREAKAEADKGITAMTALMEKVNAKHSKERKEGGEN